MITWFWYEAIPPGLVHNGVPNINRATQDRVGWTADRLSQLLSSINFFLKVKRDQWRSWKGNGDDKNNRNPLFLFL